MSLQEDYTSPLAPSQDPRRVVLAATRMIRVTLLHLRASHGEKQMSPAVQLSHGEIERWSSVRAAGGREASWNEELDPFPLDTSALLRCQVKDMRAAGASELVGSSEPLKLAELALKTNTWTGGVKLLKPMSKRQVLECAENQEIEVPRALGRVVRAWYGSPGLEWQEAGGQGDAPGLYRVLRDGTSITETSATDSDDVAQLAANTVVQVLEVQKFQETQRIRGRLAAPKAGWVSLAKTDGSGQRWAVRAIEGGGVMCTDRVRELVEVNGRVAATSKELGDDPAPRLPKKMLIEIEEEIERECGKLHLKLDFFNP